MRTLTLLALSALLTACATGGADRAVDEVRIDAALKAQLAEPVKRVFLPRISQWAPLDRRHVLIYRSPRRAYLIELDHDITNPFYDHEWSIGIRRHDNYLSAGFDYLLIDGWRYHIDTIRPLTEEQLDLIRS